MLFKRQKFDWALVALLALGLFLYVSYQPRFRLRTEMPADFIDEPHARSSQEPGPETKIARAYWSCLVNDIQWKYGHGHTLPVDPPFDFIAIERASVAPEDAASRLRYWGRAQRVWHLPTAWQKAYEWDFNWTTDWIRSSGDVLHHLFQHLGGN